MTKDTVKIEAPNLIEFVFEIEKRVQEGYRVDDTNEGLPQSWGPGLYTCTLSKTVETTEKTSEPESKDTETSDSAKSAEPKKTTRRTRKSNK